MPNSKLIKKAGAVLFIGLLLAAPLASLAQGVPTLGRQAQELETNFDCGYLDIFCGVSKFFNWVSILIGQIISYIASFLISLAATLIQLLIDMSRQVTSSPLVLEGFKVSLNIANLGFVLAIIVIGYTTIFRVSGYETKKMLRNLIVAALLVNFSLTIAGTIIDFSNVFGNFFLNSARPPGQSIGQFAEQLANSTRIQKLSGFKLSIANPNSGVVQGAGEDILKFGLAFLQAMTTVTVTAIFNVLLVITFFAIAVMLLVRYIYLAILLVLMPVAWLLFVLPSFSGMWSKWWEKFWHWNLFYPAISFFLWLSVVTAEQLNGLISDGVVGSNTAKAAASIGGVASDVVTAIIQVIAQIGILLGGLLVANSLGISGASGAMKMFGNIKDRIIGGAGKAALTLTGAPAALRAARAPAGALAQGTAKVLGSRALSWLPGAKGAAANLYNLAATRKAAVGAIQKEEFEKDSDEALLIKSKQFTADKIRKAAIVSEVVKRNLAEKMDPGQLDDYLNSAKDLEATKEILEKRPDFAPKLATKEARDKAEAEVKATKPELAGNAELIKIEVDRKLTGNAIIKFKPSNTENLPVNVLEQSAVIAGFTEAHVSRLGKEGTEAQRIALVRSSKDLDDEHPVRSAIISSPAYQGALTAILKEEKTAFADWIISKKEEREAKTKKTS